MVCKNKGYRVDACSTCVHWLFDIKNENSGSQRGFCLHAKNNGILTEAFDYCPDLKIASWMIDQKLYRRIQK